MARQHTPFQGLKSVVLAALVGIGLIILFGKLDGPAARLTNLLGVAARETLELLPAFVPAAWQALQTYAFDQRPFSPCAVQMLVSFWPLLHVMAGAV